MEISTVIQTIRHLTNRTIDKGCTEAEAQAAMKKIGELMKVYNVSMDQVFLDNNKCVKKYLGERRRRRHPIDGCVTAIAGYTTCITYLLTDTGQYVMFGLEPDVEMAKYLFDVIYAAMQNEVSKFKWTETYLKNPRKKLASQSFLRGMATRIYEKLYELNEIKKKEDLDTIKTQIASTGTSMIVVKQNKVENEFAKLGIPLKKGNRIRRDIDYAAHQVGMERANNINLQRPINGKEQLCLR